VGTATMEHAIASLALRARPADSALARMTATTMAAVLMEFADAMLDSVASTAL